MNPPGPTGLSSFVAYLKEYFLRVSIRSLLFTILLTASLVFLNYTIGIENRLRRISPWPLALFCFFLFYSFVYFSAWGIQYLFPNRQSPATTPATTSASFSLADRRRFFLLLLLAPLYFAFKMIHWDLSIFIPSALHYPWDKYTLILLQLPVKLLFLFVLIAAYGKIAGPQGSAANGHADLTGPTGLRELGLRSKDFAFRPYLLILLFLLPLVALASTQHDFLHTYPKLRNIAFINGYAHPLWPWRLLYEISYGLDFVSIELFFRGFLVIGLLRWAGPSAILPMAAFYCTIHFGKPLGECISSFAGGLALGVIAWRTRSILGGLMIHLGLAWLMETGGWLGNSFLIGN